MPNIINSSLAGILNRNRLLRCKAIMLSEKLSKMDYIEIETTPCNEDCIQVKTDADYMPEMRLEANKYRYMLYQRFPFINQLALSGKFGIKIASCSHDFGSYLELRIFFDENDSVLCDAAYFIESNLPENWTDNEVLNPEFTLKT